MRSDLVLSCLIRTATVLASHRGEIVRLVEEAQAQKEIAQAIQKGSPDKAAEVPDPGKLFQTRPPQDW